MAVTYDQLSPDQLNAIDQAVDWFNSRTSNSLPFRVFGPAGSGKTTVAEHIIRALGTTTQALAPTNRAAKVLRMKGVHNAKTIHSVLFEPVQWCLTYNKAVDSKCGEDKDSSGKVRKHDHGLRFFKKMEAPEGVRCFTIDEASMVGKKIGDDVAMFGKPTLVIGDPYQLPPVGDQPAYDDDLPGVELDSMHRFDSLSAIGQLANTIRLSSGLSAWHRQLPYVGFEERDNYDLILAWRNDTRWQVINMVRALRGRSLTVPQEGDQLISVANTYEAAVLNGDSLTVIGEPTESTHSGAWNIPTAEAGVVVAWKAGFQDKVGEEYAQKLARQRGAAICALTWSECMTVHKAQGGEWPRVLVVDDLTRMSHVRDMAPRDVNTWAYTAVTRASEQIDFIKLGEFPTPMRMRQMISAGQP